MKKSLLLLAAVLVAPAASANEVPKYGDLPKASIAPPPAQDKRPKLIGARERVEGLFVVQQKFEADVPLAARHVTVVAEKKVADSITSGEGFGGPEEMTTCLSEASRRFDVDGETAINEWDGSSTWELNLWPTSKDNPQSGIGAVHMERLVEDASGARLEMQSAWVDPNTKGARLIDKTTMPLVLVGSSIGGMRVFAAKNERADGKKFVEYVVARPKGSSIATKRSATLMSVRNDGNGGHAAGCGHLRVSLPADPKTGESAVVMTSVELPSLPASDEDADEKKEEKKPEVVAAPPEVKAKPPARKKPSIRRSGRVGSAPPGMHERELRMRDLEVHLGVSQTSRDPQPVLAVSFGWAGREQVTRIVEPDQP